MDINKYTKDFFDKQLKVDTLLAESVTVKKNKHFTIDALPAEISRIVGKQRYRDWLESQTVEELESYQDMTDAWQTDNAVAERQDREDD